MLSYLMTPPNVAEEGLEAAARRYVQGVGLRTGLRTEFQAERGLASVEAPVEHAAFRVLQEALANVYRHADASTVAVSLARGPEGLTLRIADDGKGIGPLEAGMHEGARLGVGIPGMRARVAQLGGALDIAGDETGTVVTATFPTIAAAAPARSRRDQGARVSRPAPERRSFG